MTAVPDVGVAVVMTARGHIPVDATPVETLAAVKRAKQKGGMVHLHGSCQVIFADQIVGVGWRS